VFVCACPPFNFWTVWLIFTKFSTSFIFLLLMGPAAEATDAPQPWGLLCSPVMKIMRFFLLFHFYGAPVEWKWQGKTEALGEKPVPVPLCPPQISHGPTQNRTRSSTVRGRRLTTWVMARPSCHVSGGELNTARSNIPKPVIKKQLTLKLLRHNLRHNPELIFLVLWPNSPTRA
jgi:hypothetical protein